MTRNEQQTRFDLIDPCLRDRRGWKHPAGAYAAICVEEREAAIEIMDGKARRRLTKPKDYVLYRDCTGGTEPKPIGIVEAKREGLPPDFGLQQAKDYRQGKLRHLNTVFSTNGHQFVRFDEHSGLVTDPAPLAGFPTPADLCADQVAYLGFHPADADAAAWAVREPIDAQAVLVREQWEQAEAEAKAARKADADEVEQDASEARAAALARQLRELEAKAQDIEWSIYDLKAVNPRARRDEDLRSAADLLTSIRRHGAEAEAALEDLAIALSDNE